MEFFIFVPCFMKCPATLLSKGFVAKIALVRPFQCVGSKVIHQCFLVPKFTGTVLAFKEFFLCVYSFMPQTLTGGGVLFWAILTLKWLLLGMDSDMFFKVT